MAHARLVDQRLAQHHEAAALAIDQRAPITGIEHSCLEFSSISNGLTMKLGVPPRQVDGVGVRRRRLVGQRGEEAELRPLGAPAIEEMWIEERKGVVARNRHALSQRRQAGPLVHRVRQRRRKCLKLLQVDIVADRFRRRVEEGFEGVDLTGQHQPQMPLGHRQVGAAGNGPEAGDPGRNQRRRQHALMLGRGDAVEDHAGHAHALAPIGKSGHQRRHRLALPLCIDHQHDGQAQHLGQVAGRSRPVRGAVEQAHHALDDQQVRADRLQAGQGPDPAGAGPA